MIRVGMLKRKEYNKYYLLSQAMDFNWKIENVFQPGDFSVIYMINFVLFGMNLSCPTSCDIFLWREHLFIIYY